MNKSWIIIWGLFIVVSGAAFPIYNLGKSHTYVLTGINLYLNIACYIELGIWRNIKHI